MAARPGFSREEVATTGLLALSVFLVVLSASAVTPFRAVVAVEALGLSNGAYAAILSFNAFATAVVSLVLGRMSFTIDSAVGFAVPGFCLIFTPWWLR